MELAVGQSAYREVQVSEEMVRIYANLTGDRNPLHFDREFASRTRFKELIVQGGITTGLLHAMMAMDMPGPGSVFVTQSRRFTKPVYIGDTIRATATIKSIRQGRPIADIEFVVENQRGEHVLNGEATVFQAQPS